jgi:molybdopterin-guanine dinucleotide biosynthesis protein A
MQLKKGLHPFEIFISGKEKIGKSAFIKKIIEELKGTYHIGFIDDKDITDKDFVKVQNQIKHYDIVLIEDHYNSEFCDFNLTTHIDITLEDIQKKIESLVPQTINALILTGGKSSRMQEDKAQIIYQEQNEVQRLQEILNSICKETYISCRDDQRTLYSNTEKLIIDSFPFQGPTNGILSAQVYDQKSAWLVVSCDLPYLTETTLKELIRNRNPFKNATCFINPDKNWPEPLCTIFEPKSFQDLMLYASFNKMCPRKVLMNTPIQTLPLSITNALINVNTPKDKKIAMDYFKEGKK